MGKNILVFCFDVIKGDHYYIQTRHNDCEYYFLATANTRYFKLSSKTKGHKKKNVYFHLLQAQEDRRCTSCKIAV